ncbi:MAG: asparagine synthase-related protein, partial [Acidobacteriota bacterium]|nr:asparagine synthase-related protein [Acidobacteriota bacterium]
AAAICDRSSGVVCARDLLGDRSLYYRVDGERLLVASEEQSILACPGVSAALDENRLAHFFAARVPEDSSTFFEDVRELRPGHLLSVDSGRVDVLRYARLEPPEPIHCRDDRDYAARYRELLRQSIACRSRSTSAVAVMMSGGLDSTSLVALAAAEGATQVRPASWIFDELESCDERRFMDPVVERYGLGAIRFRGDGHWPLSEPGLYNANPNAPEENAYRGLKRSLYRMVAKSGCRVALNGGSADQLYFGSQQWLADLLREGRLVEVVVGGWRELQKRGARSVAATLLRKAGLLRPPAGTWFSRAPWLTEQARRRLTSQDDARWSHWRRPAQCRNVFGAREAHSLAREVFHTNREAIDLRHPYRDRRLIDFMLAIPAHQLYHRGRFKHAARQAVWDLLPAGILVRTDRTLLTPLFERGLWRREAERVGEILGHKDAVWPRYVRPDWLEGVRRGGGEHPVDGVILWQCVAFELWRRRWGRS